MRLRLFRWIIFVLLSTAVLGQTPDNATETAATNVTTGPPPPPTTNGTWPPETDDVETEPPLTGPPTTRRPRLTFTESLSLPPPLPFAPDAYIASTVALGWISVVASVASGAALATGALDAQAMLIAGNSRCAAPQIHRISFDALSVVQPLRTSADGDATLGSVFVFLGGFVVNAVIVLFRKEPSLHDKWANGGFPSLALLLGTLSYTGVASGVASRVAGVIEASPPVIFGLGLGSVIVVAFPVAVTAAAAKYSDSKAHSYEARFADEPPPLRFLALPSVWWEETDRFERVSSVAGAVTEQRWQLLAAFPLVRALLVAFVSAFLNDVYSTCENRNIGFAVVFGASAIVNGATRMWRYPTGTWFTAAANCIAVFVLYSSLADESQRVILFMFGVSLCAASSLICAAIRHKERDWITEEIEIMEKEALDIAKAEEAAAAKAERERLEAEELAKVPPKALPMLNDLMERLLKETLPHERARADAATAARLTVPSPVRVNLAASDSDDSDGTRRRRKLGKRRGYF